MKLIYLIIILFSSFFSFSQFYIEKADFANSFSNNAFNTVYTEQNGLNYIINIKNNNTVFGGGYTYNNQVLTIDENGQQINSVELPMGVSIGRIFKKNTNFYLIGDSLKDSIPEEHNAILFKYNQNWNLIARYEWGQQYHTTFISSSGLDDRGNIYVICKHVLINNQPTAKFILYKFDANLNLLQSLGLNCAVDYDDLGSMLVDKSKIFFSGPFVQAPVSNAIQMNSVDTSLNYLGYYNFDSIYHNNNPFGSHDIGTTVYSTIKKVSESKYFFTSIFQIDRSSTFGNMKLDYDVVSTFFNPQTNQVFNYRNYFAADTIDYACPIQSADVIGNKIYVGGTSNVILDFPDLMYRDIKNYVCITLIDSMNNLVWEKKLGGDANYFAYSITATPDSGAIIVGTRYDSLNMPTVYTMNAFAWKVDKNGNTTSVGLNSNGNRVDLTIFPNPSSEQFVFKSGNKTIEEIKVYDLNGKLYLSGKHNSKEAKVNCSSLLPATYIYSIKLEGIKQFVTGKIIKTN